MFAAVPEIRFMEHGVDEEHVYLISSRTLGEVGITIFRSHFLKLGSVLSGSEDTAESHIGVKNKYT